MTFLIEISCVTYIPTGFCKYYQSVYDYPVKIAVNESFEGDIASIQKNADAFYIFLTKARANGNKHCINAMLPIMCRAIFSTCDPAFNVSIKQIMCRRICEVLSIFVCNELWMAIHRNLGNLKALNVEYPICDQLEYANGGDTPDCIDTLDGGE